jgi:hypothetical protein
MNSPIKNVRRLSTSIALAASLAAFAVPCASARIVDDYFRDSAKPVQQTGGSIVDPAVRSRLVDDSFRDAAGAGQAERALILRSDALNRKYHLGRYAIVRPTRQASGFDWGDAAIGVGALLGLVLCVGGATLEVRRRRTLAHAS